MKVDLDAVESAAETLDLVVQTAQHHRDQREARRFRRARDALRSVPDLVQELDATRDALVTLSEYVGELRAEVRRLRRVGSR